MFAIIFFSHLDLALLDVQAVETVANVFKTLEALCTEYDTTTLPLQGTSLKRGSGICFSHSVFVSK
jgi:hypothetical protein